MNERLPSVAQMAARALSGQHVLRAAAAGQPVPGVDRLSAGSCAGCGPPAPRSLDGPARFAASTDGMCSSAGAATPSTNAPPADRPT